MKKVGYSLLTLLLVLGLSELFLRVADRAWGVAERVKVTDWPPVGDRAGPYEPLSQAPDPCDDPLHIRPPELTLRQIGDNPEDPRCFLPRGHASGARRKVFIVGGSAAWGDGVEYADTFAARLGSQLGDTWSVTNAARNGADSRSVMQAVKHIVDCQAPTALIILSGNNEWLTWRHEAAPPLRYRIHHALARSFAYRYLIAGSRRVRRLRRHTEADSGRGRFDPTRGCESAERMERVADFDTEAWLKQRRNYLTAFAFHLAQITEYAAAKGVRVILCTVPYRRRLCPAYFLPQPDDDRDGAASTYFTGEEHRLAGRPHEAAMAYRRAREGMVGNLGAVLSINAVIREIARGGDTALVDLDAAFVRAGGEEIDADRLFHDFCHPNREGHELIAAELYSLFGKYNP
ncbi:MAG: SGNH/GDSL hydrolase family protein [Candidatus Lernaella stagnicola]|nr:SGNH/GDSL hydrolase family protein [Candidatus Lernaella stagnicola]